MAKPHPEVQNNLQSISVLGSSPPDHPTRPIPPLNHLQPPLAMRDLSLTLQPPYTSLSPYFHPGYHLPLPLPLYPLLLLSHFRVHSYLAFLSTFSFRRPLCSVWLLLFVPLLLRLSRNPCRDQPASQYPTRSVLIRACAPVPSMYGP